MMNLFVVLLAVSVASAAEWGYEGSKGPQQWSGVCASGKHQSPINFPKAGNTKAEFEPFNFENYNVRPEKMELKNNGHTVVTSKISMTGKMPMVSGGGLPAKYELAQFHLHWGSNDGRGSEHTIHGASYPMEVHLVHFNTEYGSSLTEALAKAPEGSNDALAVLGIMFQVERRDNTKLMPMLDALKPVATAHKTAPMESFAMEDLLPRNTFSFYRYNGSLTTPGCNEVVVWTVFKDPIEISQRQMQKFRQLTYSSNQRTAPLVDNFRPVQPLNGRTILDVFTGGACTGGAISRIVSSPLVMLSIFASLLVRRAF